MSEPTRFFRNSRPSAQRLPDWRSVAGAALVIGSVACSTAAPPVSPQASAPAAPTVVANGEQLVGAYVGKGAAEAVFRGIPYAAPPVGELRWKPPAPITPRPGVSQATKFGPSCVPETESTHFYRHIAETLGRTRTWFPPWAQQRELPLPQRLDPEPGRQGPQARDGLDSRRRERRRHRRGASDRRSEPRAQGRCGRFDELPPQRVRLPRPPGADRGVRARLVGQLRAARPDRRAPVGSAERGRLRRGPGAGDGLRRVGRRHQRHLPPGVASRARSLPPRRDRERRLRGERFPLARRGRGGGQGLRGGARRGGLEGRRGGPARRFP